MANEPKLSVFTIILNAEKEPSFYRRFAESSSVSEEDSSVFLNMCKAFITKLDDRKYHRNEKSGKAFTGQKNALDGKLAIDFHTKQFVLEGTIDGGRFGDEMEKSKINDKTVREKLEEDDVLTRKFYFFLHTPLDSNVGTLMIQSYSNDSITNDFLKFVKKFFYHESKKYKEAASERYVPSSIIEEFKEQSIVKSFSFKQKMLLGHLDNSTVGENKKEFFVTINVVSKDGIRKKDYDKWMKSMGEGKFAVGKTTTPFTDFSDKKATIKNEKIGKSTSFDITNKFDIKPVIYLDDSKINFLGPRKIDFDSLKKFCFKILKEIETEVYSR